jgi:hypothetical protein
MDGATLAQFGSIAFEISGLEETWLPVAAALDDMPRHVGKIEAWLAWHREKVETVAPVLPCDRFRSVGDLRLLMPESPLCPEFRLTPGFGFLSGGSLSER